MARRKSRRSRSSGDGFGMIALEFIGEVLFILFISWWYDC